MSLNLIHQILFSPSLLDCSPPTNGGARRGWGLGGRGFIVFLLILLSACSDDEYNYPSVKLEFLTAYSGADGYLHSIRTDDGDLVPILEDRTATQMTADSVARFVSNYELLTADGQTYAKLYALSSVVSPVPKAADEFEEDIKTDPADMLSIWMGYDYLNLTLEVKEGGTHKLHFIEDEVTTDPATGTREVRLTLYHDAGEEPATYTRRVYASVPLAQYVEADITRLVLHFSLHTYSGELKTYDVTCNL